MTSWALIVPLLWIVTAPSLRHGAGEGPGVPKYYLPYQFSNFSDDPAFYQRAYHSASVTQRPREQARPGKGAIRCGIVSHHLFVADLIADYFNRLSDEVTPHSIILLGPNHHSRGHAVVAVSALPWKTPFGLVEPDLELVRELNQDKLATTDEDAFFNEHSIGALAAFIKRSFPNSRLTAMVVRTNHDTALSSRLADWISKKSKSGILVLASLDFSHYKTSAQAQREDSLTYQIISNLDCGNCSGAFVDSRSILSTILGVCRRINAEQIQIVHHTNSGLISGHLDASCTSYMNLFFRMGKENQSQGSFPLPKGIDARSIDKE